MGAIKEAADILVEYGGSFKTSVLKEQPLKIAVL
jgi:hypothetical protein